MNAVRVWLKKSGNAKYISHLDINRCMTRTLRRSGLPVWYTQGFNPHVYLTFPLPLPLGQEGLREPMDIRLEEELPLMQVHERLAAALPPGFAVVAVTRPWADANEIARAHYQIRLRFANETAAQQFVQRAKTILEGGVLQAEKKSKKGIQTVNLCDFIVETSWQQTEKTATLDAMLLAGGTRNLNAALLTQTLLAQTGEHALQTQIVRTGLFTEAGTPWE